MPEICLQIIKNRVATSKILKPFKLLRKVLWIHKFIIDIKAKRTKKCKPFSFVSFEKKWGHKENLLSYWIIAVKENNYAIFKILTYLHEITLPIWQWSNVNTQMFCGDKASKIIFLLLLKINTQVHNFWDFFFLLAKTSTTGFLEINTVIIFFWYLEKRP